MTKAPLIPRRAFLQQCLGAAACISTVGAVRAQTPSKTPLGLDAYSLRGMKWKSLDLIKFATEQNLDAVLFNGLQYFESLDPAHLARVKEAADAGGLRIYVGAGGISEGAKSFSKTYGGAEATLVEGIRVAVALGSPTVNCRIGNVDDRYTEGGIEPRIEEAVKTLKAVRSRALDAGLKFAFENHGGDTRSEEVLALIEAAGTDYCGVMLDPGNAVWAMEDPMQQLQKQGSHVLCTSVRDYMIWESEEGATFQWTAIGQGLMDVPAYTRLLAEECPGVPLFVETISNFQRPISFLKPEFWKGYPKLRAADMADSLALCRRGHPMNLLPPPAAVSVQEFDRQQQRAEFDSSIACLRKCGVGVKK